MTRFPFHMVLLVLVFAACDTGAGLPEETTEEATLGAVLIERAVQGSLRATTLRLNNYGTEDEEQRESWLRSNDAVLQFGETEIRFSLPEVREKQGPFAFLYYVQDLNARPDAITVTSQSDSSGLRFLVEIPFEEDGAEFKGHCVSSGWVGSNCLTGRDRAAPDVQWDAVHLTLVLEPVVFEQGLSMAVTSVALGGTVQAGGVCNLGLGGVRFDVCHLLTDYKDVLQPTIENLVYEELHREAIQRMVAHEVRPLLNALHIGDVVALRTEGDVLFLTHRPPVV